MGIMKLEFKGWPLDGARSSIVITPENDKDRLTINQLVKEVENIGTADLLNGLRKEKDGALQIPMDLSD